MRRGDPSAVVAGLRPGVRVSVRLTTAAGRTDIVGLVRVMDEDTLTVADRRGRLHTVRRAAIECARIVPTVARGRNPRHAPPAMLTALAHDPVLATPPGQPCWVARLCEVVDHLDDTLVTPLPGAARTATTAAYATSRGLVNGEWAALRLLAAAHLEPLAAWAARRDARNVVLTSPLPEAELHRLHLERLEP